MKKEDLEETVTNKVQKNRSVDKRGLQVSFG